MNFIKNVEMITDKFKKWPNFHDAEIISCDLNRKDVMLMLDIYLFNYSKGVDSQGFLNKENKCIVRIQFKEISKLSLDNFNQQNVISELILKQNKDGKINVEIISSFGLEGDFECLEVEVLEVKELK